MGQDSSSLQPASPGQIATAELIGDGSSKRPMTTIDSNIEIKNQMTSQYA